MVKSMKKILHAAWNGRHPDGDKLQYHNTYKTYCENAKRTISSSETFRPTITRHTKVDPQ